MGYFVKQGAVVGQQGVVIPAGATATRPSAPLTGGIRFNSDTTGLEYFDGTAFIELARTGAVTTAVDSYVGDNGTVAFLGLSYAPLQARDIMVFINGIYQIPVTAYDVAGTTITFTSPPPLSETIIVLHGFANTYVAPGDAYDVPNL